MKRMFFSLMVVSLFSLVNCSYTVDWFNNSDEDASGTLDAEYKYTKVGSGYNAFIGRYSDFYNYAIVINWPINSKDNYFVGREIYCSKKSNDEFADYNIIASYDDCGENVLHMSDLGYTFKSFFIIEPVFDDSIENPAVIGDSFHIPEKGCTIFLRGGYVGKKEDDKTKEPKDGTAELKSVTKGRMIVIPSKDEVDKMISEHKAVN